MVKDKRSETSKQTQQNANRFHPKPWSSFLFLVLIPLYRGISVNSAKMESAATKTPRTQHHSHLSRFFTGLSLGPRSQYVNCGQPAVTTCSFTDGCACVNCSLLCEWSRSLLGSVPCPRSLWAVRGRRTSGKSTKAISPKVGAVMGQNQIKMIPNMATSPFG